MKRTGRLLLFLLAALAFSPRSSAQKISGLVYMDYFQNIARDSNGAPSGSAQGGAKDLYGFQFRRIFLTTDYDISPKITSRFQIESDGVTIASKDSAGKAALNVHDGVHLKTMYVQIKDVFENHDLIVGLQPTLAFPLPESIWSYRSVEKTITDLRGITPPRDFAVTFKGKISEGQFDYAVQYGNAAMLNEADKFKRLSASFAAHPTKNFDLSVYGEQKWMAGDKNVNNVTFCAGYSEKEKYMIGAEYVISSAKNSYLTKDTTVQNLTKSGISVFGYYFISHDLAALARFDMFNPNTNDDATDISNKNTNARSNTAENYVIVGLDWKVEKKFSVIPNIQFSSFSGVKNSADGSTKTIAPSITARVTFELKL